MDWVRAFYSVTGRWWGRAESAITDREHDRVAAVRRLCGEAPLRILELGCGCGNTVAAMSAAGHHVVGVEISDRADFSPQFAEQLAPTSRIVKADFYRVALDGRFDVVTYWNGFGVGSDSDQRTLLRRIADEWLADGGTALIDVANPFVWARWHGVQEHHAAQPDAGYDFDLTERTTFDPVTCRARDTWWITDRPDERWTQTIRCYTPADLRRLLEATGLSLAEIVVAGDRVDVAEHGHHDVAVLLTQEHEYLAALTRG